MGFVECLMLSCIVSLSWYVGWEFYHGRMPSLQHVIESNLWGAAVVAGIHLIYCAALCPAGLIHLRHLDGRHILIDGSKATMTHVKKSATPAGEHEAESIDIAVEMSELHRLHVFGCGAGTAYLGLAALIAVCRKQGSPVLVHDPTTVPITDPSPQPSPGSVTA